MVLYYQLTNIVSSMNIEKRMEKARNQVANLQGRQSELARDIDVSYQWLRKFASGDLVEPGAVKFDRLEAWLRRET